MPQEKRLRPDPVPPLAAHIQDVRRTALKSLPRESPHEKYHRRNRHRAQRRHHQVRGAARAAKSRIDQRKSGAGKWHQEDKHQAKRCCRFGKNRAARRRHSCSPRGAGCARITRTSPRISTPMPASTNATLGASRRQQHDGGQDNSPACQKQQKTQKFHRRTPRNARSRCSDARR